MSVSDNFNRADGSLGANWTDQGNGPVIVSNEAKGNNLNNYGSAFWNANSFNADHDSQFVWVNGTQYVAPAVRMSGTGGGTNWYAYFSNGEIQKSVAGSITLVANTGAPVAVGGTILKLGVTGTTLTPSINGVAQTTGTDSALATGSAGIAFYNNAATIDDWVATGEVGAAVVGAKIIFMNRAYV